MMCCAFVLSFLFCLEQGPLHLHLISQSIHQFEDISLIKGNSSKQKTFNVLLNCLILTLLQQGSRSYAAAQSCKANDTGKTAYDQKGEVSVHPMQEAETRTSTPSKQQQ